MRVLSFAVFVVLKIVFLPLGLVGVLLVGYKQLVISKRLGLAQSAIEVINGRWTMHVFDIRSDPATVRLADALPNTSTLGLWLCLLPLWVKYKICGTLFAYPRVPEEGAEDLADIIIARTLYFDRIIHRVSGEVEQFVVLGAGYDTRAYNELRRAGLRCFEVDQATMQQHKVVSLQQAGIDAAHVTFVQVDFRQEGAFEELRANGYDATKKTLFLWEGVTLYLSEVDVRKTLRDIRAHAPSGSVVVADFYAERFLNLAGGGAAKKVLEYTGEGTGFFLPFATDFEQCLTHFFDSEGLTGGETDFLGRTSDKGPFMVVTEIRI
jgi:methyltransferase (TIGR00027 family)